MKFFRLPQLGQPSELLSLFLGESFRAAAYSFLNIFSAIFVYKSVLQMGKSHKIALMAVVFYNLGFYLCKLISLLIAEETSRHQGLKKALFLGQILLIAGVLFLFFLPRHFLFLAMFSLLTGLASGFYWTGYHGLLAKIGKENHFGKQIGVSGTIRNILLMATPFLGGVLINFWGYTGLFIGAILFIILSFLLSLPVKERKTTTDTSLQEILDLFKSQQKAFWGHFGHSFAGTVYGTIFPLYIFFVFNKELSLGGFFSLAMISAAVINYLVGKWIDSKGWTASLVFGSVVSSLAWLGRAITKNPAALLTLETADRLTAPMTSIPIDVLTYEKAIDGRATGRAVLFREVAFGIGSIFAGFFLLGLVMAGLKFEYSFFAAAVFSLFSIFFAKEKTGKK